MEFIRTENLKKTYLLGKLEVPALRGVDISIEKGEFVAIMGPSGSGKSTLLHLCGMLDTPTYGDVIIDGMKNSELRESERASFRLKTIGFVFQFFNLLSGLTAFENVALPIMLSKKDDYNERTKELLEIVGLTERKNHKPTELSGGQQQRIAIARALANDPKILLADEPTGNLDTKAGGEILNLFKKLNKEKNQTIAMVTHELAYGKLADRIIFLKDGIVEKRT
ncbi:MAG: ABC transporter ATP-binding protein [Candidatus Micrarchaeota archaeon]